MNREENRKKFADYRAKQKQTVKDHGAKVFDAQLSKMRKLLRQIATARTLETKQGLYSKLLDFQVVKLVSNIADTAAGKRTAANISLPTSEVKRLLSEAQALLTQAPQSYNLRPTIRSHVGTVPRADYSKSFKGMR